MFLVVNIASQFAGENLVLYSPNSVEGVNVAIDRFSLSLDWRDEDMHSTETHSLH